MQKVLIVGADKEVIELAESLGLKIVGIVDKNKESEALGYPCLGTDEDWPSLREKNAGIKVVLPLDNGKLKEKLFRHYEGENILGLRSSQAYISERAKVSSTSIVQMGSKVLTSATVGECCKINIGAVIHHDGKVGNFCTLAPGALLLGAVTLGNGVFVGAGAIVLPKIKIGDFVTIGAGAVVTKDVPSGTVIAGVPARPL